MLKLLQFHTHQYFLYVYGGNELKVIFHVYVLLLIKLTLIHLMMCIKPEGDVVCLVFLTPKLT